MTLQTLRIHAATHTLFPPASLKSAVERLGFVQADPIRSPARAQDLILRHRVKDYRAGDLERRYSSLDIEEDYLYAYGFVHRRVWQLIHPRNPAGLSELEKKVLDAVRRDGKTHPATLETYFGRDRVVNAWGGYSKATTSALEHLHYRGLLRIAQRENGIRVYEPVPAPIEPFPSEERLRRLILTLAGILAPIPSRTLHTNIAGYRDLGNPRAAVRDLINKGELQSETVGRLEYIWTPRRKLPEEMPRIVRFLAPFDPVVWDRRRFEHLWGWPYRFEAYTPPAKRVRGYYAMPLLWCDNIIGWANASVIGSRLSVDVGFVKKRPREAEFRRELEAEESRLAVFLGL